MGYRYNVQIETYVFDEDVQGDRKYEFDKFKEKWSEKICFISDILWSSKEEYKKPVWDDLWEHLEEISKKYNESIQMVVIGESTYTENSPDITVRYCDGLVSEKELEGIFNKELGNYPFGIINIYDIVSRYLRKYQRQKLFFHLLGSYGRSLQ